MTCQRTAGSESSSQSMTASGAGMGGDIARAASRRPEMARSASSLLGRRRFRTGRGA